MKSQLDIKSIDLWDEAPIDVSAEVNMIWSVANRLRGTYQSDKYKDVIIPMTILRRFECALAETKDKVVKQFEKNPNYPRQALCRLSGFQFYNTSKFTLEELLNDSSKLGVNFRSYIKGFSPNVIDIFNSLEFDKQIDKMDRNDRLYSVVQAFSEMPLWPKTVDNIKMGYIFEELIRKFSENAEAGDHYTGRDIIKLMVSLLLAEGCDDVFEHGKTVTILDQAAGTGGMLSTAHTCIQRLNNTADVRLFSQEVNPESYAMCLAEMLIRGQNADNIRFQDTMKADCFPTQKMRFVIENPPFGTPWGGKDAAEGVESAVKAETAKAEAGRFPAGLPKGDDMQLLFMQSAVDKMAEGIGRAAIVENGSPLFSGGTASGESQIRRWLLENDLIEAIIQLPTDMFYNTGISTYIWILSKNKRKERRNKVQLIDASGFYHKLRKALGDKKNEIAAEDRAEITRLYADFKECELCKIFDYTEFKYREYAVMQPLQRSYGISEERIGNMLQKGSLDNIYDEVAVYKLESAEELNGKDTDKLNNYKRNKARYDAILARLRGNMSDTLYMNPESFLPVLTQVLEGFSLENKTLEKIMDGLSVMDKTADIQRDKKGNIIYDKETKDTEIVPWNTDIADYMEREVLPHVPDAKAFFEEDLKKKKPVIKTGAEIPFTRYFFKYEAPQPSAEIANEIRQQEASLSALLAELFND